MKNSIVVKSKNDEWLFITPIYSLELGKSISKELKIGRVTFIDVTKIPRVRKRLGFPVPLSRINETKFLSNYFKLSKTYAICTFRGDSKDEKLRYDIRKEVEKATHILGFSQLGYCNRRRNSQFGMIDLNTHTELFILNKNEYKSSLCSTKESKILPFRIGKKWLKFHKDFFFLEFLKLIDSKKKMNKKWKDTIIRAAEMSGKSMMSRDLEYAFLWNMIAIEMLLPSQDKYMERLPELAEAFIGWVDYWEDKNYQEKIKDAYLRRCELVHNGNSNNITVEHVIFTDDLLFNLMWNIVTHIDMFPNKESVREFSEKVKSEKLLGVKPQVQPGTLHFMNREYDIDDYLRI
ncbi:hypothetical protein GCQ56_07650 [Marinifilum sp. N1E240]|uniref:HEPN domain-containing protein n=1 Tax=Marinifilum sp. N1E240 TaxID=2608082 RepID=UPI00128B6414|nr:HEPN domain-containing protein [Marinifilum sp. N1E240]MPQ46887.1 hypothetical protein [Marinifilum sp. N1E240]